MKPAITLTFAYIVCFLFAALLYTSDPDVNGIQGLTSLGGVFAVVLLSFFPFALMGIILRVYSQFGTKMSLITLLFLASAFSFFILTISQPNLSFSETLEAMTRSTLVITGVLILGALPYWLTCLRRSVNE